jgi:hypothetical protein
MLEGRRDDRVGQASIANDTIGRQAHSASGRDDAAAPIAEYVAIGEIGTAGLVVR